MLVLSAIEDMFGADQLLRLGRERGKVEGARGEKEAAPLGIFVDPAIRAELETDVFGVLDVRGVATEGLDVCDREACVGSGACGQGLSGIMPPEALQACVGEPLQLSSLVHQECADAEAHAGYGAKRSLRVVGLVSRAPFLASLWALWFLRRGW